MGNKKRLLAWLLVIAMAFTSIGSNGMIVQAASEQGTEVTAAGEGTDNLATWAAGITDEQELAKKKAVWMDTSKSVDERVEALLSAMTLEEKVAQMVQPEQLSSTPEDVKNYGIGSVLSGGGSAPETGNTAQDWADRVNSFKQAALESRLGIPLIYGVDAVHGHNNVDDTVIFPHNIGFGAADDAALAKEAGQAAAEEIRATGIQWTFAPTLGVVYSERWGRFYESFGEDADLAARMGEAFVKGFQGTDAQGDAIGNTSVAATAKHYIGEGQTENGVNQGNVNMTEEEFEALFSADGDNLIKPYEDAIAAGAKTVMASYNSVDGVKCHGNKRLLTDILKGERTEENPLGLDFKGFVVSDYNGLDQIEEGTYQNYYFEGSTDVYTARVAASIDAGVDMFMEPYDWKDFMTAAKKNVEAGVISTERIDDAVSRILRVKFEMGLFEEEIAGETEQALLAKVGSDEHRAVAKQAVEESLVVLKNDEVGETGKTALQILQNANSIMVAGYKGNDIGAQCGGWTISWQGGLDSDNGSGGNKVTSGTTIYEGFKETAKDGTTVSYNARGKISGQDVAVVVVGEAPYAESNGDRAETDLVLPETDVNVIKTAIASKGNTPVVLVLLTGRPVAIADYIDDVDAVVEAWLPGTEGDGVAEVMLNSEKDFTGTLPVTWTWYPTDLTNKFTDSSKVLFPYGTGLKKDGTSIKEGGQTAIPAERPEAPEEEEAASIITYKGGIDIDAYAGKLEAEFCQSTSGDFSSYNIEVKSENGLSYVNYDKKEWANAKWKVYFRQAGTYKVTARMQVTESGMFVCGIGQDLSQDNLGGEEKFPTPSVSDDYQDVEIGTYEISNTGLYGIKIMDIENSGWTTSHLKAKLDYLTLELVEAKGEKDEGQEEVSEDPSDTTAKPSEGNLLQNDAVEVYMTSSEKSGDMSWYKYPTEMAHQMEKMDSLPLTSVDDQQMTTISIDPTKEYQEILGFGTSLEESTINNLAQLTPEVQDEFLRKLVDPNQAGMTLFRVTIGTSDFTSKKFYTYYDAKELTEENAIKNADGTLTPDWDNTTGNGFSIQKDIDYKIVDTIKKIQALAEEYGVEDEVRFFASSWTPPGWMKTETSSSKSYADNDLLIKGGALNDEHIEDVAKYYTRYLEEYAKQGIDIYAITLQNEPMLEIDYPSCAMTGEQEGKLAVAIKKEVAASEVLNTSQKQVKLWAFDHNPSGAYSYTEKILSVDGASEALDGIAFHDYGGSLTEMQRVLDDLLNQDGRNDQTVNLTERSVWGTTGANSIITYLRNSAISYNSWVTMLDSNVGVHQWVGTPDPTMFARAAGSDNDYWAMPEYYITGQFSRFIRPGYVRVDSNLGSSDTVTNVVFKNPETDELVAVVVNQTDKKQNFKLVCNGTQIIGALPAKNVATYVWSVPSQTISNPQDGFASDQYDSKSDGVKSGSDDNGSYITFDSADDFANYIVNIPKAGLNYVDVEMTNQAADGDDYLINVLQNDEVLGSGVAVKADGTHVIRIPVSFEKAGVQQITLKVNNSGIKVYGLKVTAGKDVQQVPGKILASDYVAFAGENNTSGGTVLESGVVEYTGWWSKYTYKVDVPADGTYAFTVSAAAAGNEKQSGFWLNSVTEEGDTPILTKGVSDFGGNDEFAYSGDWGKYELTTGEIELKAGENTLRLDAAENINIAWIAIGSYVDVTADAITEGAEDGKTVTISVIDGSIADGDIKVNGLPEGVEYTTEMNGNTLTLKLKGNRTVDFDKDITITVDVPVIQGSSDTELTNQAEFIIKAVNDAESLVKPDSVQPVELNSEVKIPVKINGGTFNVENADKIKVTGNALLNYTLNSIDVKDVQTVELTLEYTKKIYKAAELTIEVPVAAYDDSTGNAELTTSVSFEAEDGQPDAIEASESGKITLTEDKAFASNGSFSSDVAEGNYVDYFIDIKKAGNYRVTYALKTLTSDGTSYSNAWDVNRGEPGTVGTNSYKQVSIPGLWTTDTVKIHQNVELKEGKQTFELKAKKGGYVITSVEIEPQSAKAVSATEDTVIAAIDYADSQNDAVVLGENVEYTVDGTSLDYVIETEKSGTYAVKVNYAIESASDVSFNFSKVSDGNVTELGSVAVEKTGSWSTFKDSTPVKVKLSEGETILRVYLTGDGANIKSITLTPVEDESENPDPENPDPENPDPENPDPENPDKPSTGGEQPSAGGDKPSTGGEQPSAGGDKPSTGGEQPSTGGEQPEEAKISSVNIAVAGRPYSANTLYVKKNGSVTLKATVTGTGAFNKNVTWNTSNKKVAKVSSNGKVKVVAKKGTAKITAVSVGDASKVASITIQAVSKAVSNKTLKLKKSTIQLKEKGATAQIQIKKYTKNTTDSVTYKVKSGKSYVKVDKYGVVTSKVQPGSKARTAKIEVKCGKKKAVVTVKIPKK